MINKTLLIIVILITKTYALNIETLYISDIRYKTLFILKNKNLSNIKDNNLYRNNKIVGKYEVLLIREGIALCKLYQGEKELISINCYIKLKDVNTSKEISLKPKINLKEYQNKLIIPEKLIKPEVKKENILIINHQEYIKLRNKFIIKEPIRFDQISSIDNLENYLKRIENNSNYKYIINILKESDIKNNRSYFSKIIKNKFILCVVKDRIGYAEMKSGKIVIQNIMKDTLNRFKKKFYFYYTLEKK